MVVKIKELPSLERPYEKLEYYGVESLSNEELLAILLRTGNKYLSSKELANRILSKLNSLSSLKEMTYEQLLEMNGVGRSKACTILAAIELSKRIDRDITEMKNKKITSSEIVYQYYKNKIGDKKQEHFYVIYLDNAKKVIRDQLLFKGTVNYSIVHPREIFKEAYLLSASAIICVHNHPSGNIFPSKEDIEITKKIEEIGMFLGIKLLDHVIIGYKNYYSFLENKNIEGS